MQSEFSKRIGHCKKCILWGHCTRTAIYANDGYCWADELYKKDGTTKEELARRHEIIE